VSDRLPSALLGCLLLALSLVACAREEPGRLRSPDGRLSLAFALDDDGAPRYRAWWDDEVVLLPSGLGLELKDAPPLSAGLRVIREARREVDEPWTTVWGQREEERDRFEELRVELQEEDAPGRRIDLVFRAYDDGLAFRYELPAQEGLDELVITEERTRFAFAADHRAWWIPDCWDSYELRVSETPLSELGEGRAPAEHGSCAAQEAFRGANTPLVMRSAEGLHLALHEARLVDYAGMTLVPDPARPLTLVSALVPWANGDKVRGRAPLVTPWRVLQMVESAGGLITSSLILDLNDPPGERDLSFVRPMSFVGVWWGMHLGLLSWIEGDERHGATTAEARRHIDFAAENGIGGVLIEGWNKGWDTLRSSDELDLITPAEDFDLEAVARYAQARGVQLIGHHETGGKVAAYEAQLDAAFARAVSLGIATIKTGYAGPIRPGGHHRHGQHMVRHYRRVLEAAWRHGINLNVHEPIKGTGLERTFPNMLTREGVRSMEWNAWSAGNAPSHTATLPFTRGLAGPMDYSPGIFDPRYERFGHQIEPRVIASERHLTDRPRVQSTLARQLALFVVLWSPLQMAADLIESYEGHPALAFIAALPNTWSETRVLSGEIGEHLVLARRERGGPAWFLGAITDEEARTIEVELSFLDDDTAWRATVYGDAVGAHYLDAPTALRIEPRTLEAGQALSLTLAPGGGQAMVIRPVSRDHPATTD
jgi:alpha-glucosidase